MSGMYPNEKVVEVFGEQVKWPGLSPDGRFTNGSFSDPSVKPSFIPAETLNLLIDNMQHVVEEAGLSPNNIQQDQLLAALHALVMRYLSEDAASGDVTESQYVALLNNKVDKIAPIAAVAAAAAKKVAYNAQGQITASSDLTALDLGRGYGTSTTAAATAAKVGTLANFARSTGAVVGIKFTYANTAASPTLNVNATGAAAIVDCRTGAAPAAAAMGATAHFFQFDGASWVLLNPLQGKKTATLTVGTTAAGHTLADCDYLCTGASDQTPINNAIAALPATGGKIVILEGTYNIAGRLNVNKANVKIEGMGASTILKRMYNESSANYGLLYVTAANCTISDLQIDGNKSSYNNANNNGILIVSAASNCQILSNICSNLGGCCIATFGSNCKTTRNILTNSLYGIYCTGSDNTIKDNTCSGSANNGIHNLGNGNKISGNICNQSSGTGIYGGGGSDNSIENNTSNGAGTGIYTGGDNNKIKGNICKDNTNYGIYCNGSRCLIDGNTVFRGTGLQADYTSSQYTIYLDSNNNDLIVNNLLMGKNYVNNGGSTNTFANNKYN